jgi:hypothetical protein
MNNKIEMISVPRDGRAIATSAELLAKQSI